MQENYKPYIKDPTKIYVDGNLYPRHVVCAANRFSDGLIICGARHWDGIMVAVADKLELDERHGCEQGFIDQYGHFITRTEAAQISKTNNQPMRDPIPNGDYAFSENFY